MRDIDIRRALRNDVLSPHYGAPDTVVVEELGILQGAARVDVAVVNGLMHGYEIKSESDTLLRLPRQADLYSRVFDRITLVVSERHAEQAEQITPPWWEVVVVSLDEARSISFDTHRSGSRNDAVDARSVAELLWRDEALQLLEARQAARGVRGGPRRLVWDRLCEVYTLEEIQAAVRDRLKERSRPQAVQSQP